MKSLLNPELKLHYSQPVPCSYLPDRVERQLFMLLDESQMLPWSDHLNRLGFRRSMNSVYVPACDGCRACRSVRIDVEQFCFSRNQKKLLRRHGALRVRCDPLKATKENFSLFKRYLAVRHAGSEMNMITFPGYTKLLERAPQDAFALTVYDNDRLLGMMSVDQFSDGLSAVYSYYEPEMRKKWSLGKFMVLSLVALAKRKQLSYVYLGYYVADSSKMAYKAQFAPMEEFDDESIRWIPFTP